MFVASATGKHLPMPAGDDDSDLLVLHEALRFGSCHLGLGVPMTGRFAGVDSLDALRAMGWSEQQPLRCVGWLGGRSRGVCTAPWFWVGNRWWRQPVEYSMAAAM